MSIATAPLPSVRDRSTVRPITITRNLIDKVAVGAGALVAVVLVAAGALLTWGASFADSYVADELAAQNISFPAAEALAEDRPDLLAFAGDRVDTGVEAEAYADYIGGHVANIAGGQTYADLGDTERAAKAAVAAARDAGESDAAVAELQAEADRVAGQRDSVFKGEMLRGALLNAYAWSTVGRIAQIAAIGAFAAAGLMAAAVAAGVVHLRRTS